MAKKELLKQCRFYNGEERNPYADADGNAVYFWQAENTFFHHDGKAHSSDEEFYKALGGKDYPGIPRALLITLFSYWSTGTRDAKAEFPLFDEWMKEYQKKGRE